MDIRAFIDDTARAVGFLSRLPVPARYFAGHDGRLGRVARAFPLAGALVALPPAVLAAALAALGVPPLLNAFATLMLATLTTGALHEDGLADSADGLGGGRDREAALAIMKDSRTGAYGVVALILVFGLRAAAIAALVAAFPPLGLAMALVAVAAMSRAAMVWHWSSLPSARENGVAASAGAPEPEAARTALVWGVGLAALLVLPQAGLAALLLMLAAVAAAVLAFGRLAARRIGGHTGDTIGATQQLSEAALLFALAGAL